SPTSSTGQPGAPPRAPVSDRRLAGHPYMWTDIGRERAMSSATGRTKLMLAAIAAATVLAVSAPAVGRQTSAAKKGLSVDDTAYYLDVGGTLPVSFRRLTPDDVTEVVGDDGDPTAVAYQSDESRAAVIVHLEVGKGRSSRAVLGEILNRLEQRVTAEDMAQLFADEGVTADRISVDPAEWSDVDAGDSAKTGDATVAIDG